eukprot:c6681_g1_i2.p1 GENE.c6681_g1_i2~~c6681_g1_i2.p1  ORF type:complete len:227 (-),score=57.49 c6681_g1_i2:262-942(-)
MGKVEFTVPAGAKPGDEIIMTMNGEKVAVVIPAGAKPGSVMVFSDDSASASSSRSQTNSRAIGARSSSATQVNTRPQSQSRAAARHDSGNDRMKALEELTTTQDSQLAQLRRGAAVRLARAHVVRSRGNLAWAFRLWLSETKLAQATASNEQLKKELALLKKPATSKPSRSSHGSAPSRGVMVTKITELQRQLQAEEDRTNAMAKELFDNAANGLAPVSSSNRAKK